MSVLPHQEAERFVTHNGIAHRDDFLASCFLIAKFFPRKRISIERVDWTTDEDLASDSVFVYDFGKSYDTDLKNFDHHQMEPDKPVCAFSLILEYFGILDYGALPWVRGVEIWDHCGPDAYFDWLGSNNHPNKTKIFCPVIESALKKFSAKDFIAQYDPFYYEMRDIGQLIIDEYNNFYEKLKDLEDNVKFLEFDDIVVADFRGTNQDLFNYGAEQFFLKGAADFILNENKRSGGNLRLIRRSNKWDLNKAKDLCGFVHTNGFLACFEGEEKVEEIVRKTCFSV